MDDTVTLRLSRSEALALDALVNNSAEKFFMVVGGDKEYRLQGWKEGDAAAACDKLREAILGQEQPDGWRELLTRRIK